MLGQIRAFATFARAVLRHTDGVRYDLVFATSSRLMTAALGAFVARRVGARLYLDIRDIFVDTIGDVLPRPWGWPIRGAIRSRRALDHWTRRARQPRFARLRGYFHRRYPDRAFGFVTNGIDEEFVEAAPSRRRRRRGSSVARIVYAGNIGDGQALHRSCPTSHGASREPRRVRRDRRRRAPGRA